MRTEVLPPFTSRIVPPLEDRASVGEGGDRSRELVDDRAGALVTQRSSNSSIDSRVLRVTGAVCGPGTQPVSSRPPRADEPRRVGPAANCPTAATVATARIRHVHGWAAAAARAPPPPGEATEVCLTDLEAGLNSGTGGRQNRPEPRAATGAELRIGEVDPSSRMHWRTPGAAPAVRPVLRRPVAARPRGGRSRPPGLPGTRGC